MSAGSLVRSEQLAWLNDRTRQAMGLSVLSAGRRPTCQAAR